MSLHAPPFLPLSRFGVCASFVSSSHCVVFQSRMHARPLFLLLPDFCHLVFLFHHEAAKEIFGCRFLIVSMRHRVVFSFFNTSSFMLFSAHAKQSVLLKNHISGSYSSFLCVCFEMIWISYSYFMIGSI